jgi:hypothetical protein
VTSRTPSKNGTQFMGFACHNTANQQWSLP